MNSTIVIKVYSLQKNNLPSNRWKQLYKRGLMFVCFVFLTSPIFGKEELLAEVEAKWKFDSNSRDYLSYDFGVLYRSVYYDSGRFDYDTSFLELKTAPKYTIDATHAISFEIRYRFAEIFDDDKIDEKRMAQQYHHKHKFNTFDLQGRLSIEERFRDKFTMRNRYRIGFSFDLNQNLDPLKVWKFTASTEALWSVARQKKPTFDQRFTLIVEKPISKFMTVKLKPEYRYLDYTNDPRNVLRIYMVLGFAF